MTRQSDPFERAVSRAEKMRRRAAAFETRSGMMRMAIYCVGALGIGWAILLAAHWIVFPEPRWLTVLHSVVFSLVAGYHLVVLAFVGSLKRNRPELFGDL